MNAVWLIIWLALGLLLAGPAFRLLRAIARRSWWLVRERIVKDYHRQWLGRCYHRAQVEEKIVALTFDDGPLPPWTGKLLDVLARHDVKATFFLLGRKIEEFPDTARAVHEAGHQIGNHSYSHPHLWRIWPTRVTREIRKTDRLIRSLGVDYDIDFRAPYGEKFLVLPFLLWRMGKRHISFDFFPSPRDWKGSPPDEVVASVVAQTHPGSIIVLHDGNPEGAPLVAVYADLVISELKSRGFRFATVDRLLALEGQH